MTPWAIAGALVRVFFLARKCDILFIQKLRLLPKVLKRLVPKVKIVYDFDDSIFHPPPKWPEHKSFERRKELGDIAITHADLVIAGNQYLADYARRFNKSVAVIPSVVETGQLDVKVINYERWGFVQQIFVPETRSREGVPLVVGWIGGAGSLRFLDRIGPILRDLQCIYPFEMRVISSEAWQFPGLSVTNKKWSLVEEVRDIQQFDIGLMPLESDNPFVQGKCGFKAIEYMACGLPVVASAVGANVLIIEHGVSGYLASGEDEWFNCLQVLLEDVALRRRIGKRARNRVEEVYSIAAVLPQLLSALHEL